MREIEPLDSRAQFEKEFKEYFENPQLPMEWDDSRQARVKELTQDSRVRTARVATIPMVCRGSSCPLSNQCPLFKEDIAPIGHPCPIESEQVKTFMLDMIRELEIDPESTIEIGMVRDLVDQEIQQIRKQVLLANEDIIQENVVGVDEEGTPIMKKELHLAVTWEDKIHKRKQALLKSLLATRESKVNAGAKVMDGAQNMAALITQFAKSERDYNKSEDELGDDKDQYIEAHIVSDEADDNAAES